MNTRHATALSVVLAIGSLTGCVSSGKYKKLEADHSALQGRVASLEQEKAALTQQKEQMAQSSAQTETQYNALLSQMAEEVQKGDLKVTQYKNMLSVDVAEQIFFASGSAKLKTTGEQILAKLAKALNNYPDKIIRVVGHTDNVPVSKETQKTFPSNWELSVVRATNVVRFLQQNGVSADRLIASGRGEFAPVAPNNTADGRQKNRRIEIMLLDKTLIENMERR